MTYSTYFRPKTRGVQTVHGRISRVYLPKKDRSADVRTGYFCLGSGKTWVVRGPNTGGVALFHGWRSCFEGPRHCFGFLESLAEVMVRFWPFRELCRGSWTRFWPSRGLCRDAEELFWPVREVSEDLWDQVSASWRLISASWRLISASWRLISAS